MVEEGPNLLRIATVTERSACIQCILFTLYISVGHTHEMQTLMVTTAWKRRCVQEQYCTSWYLHSIMVKETGEQCT